ncbi:MAG: 5-oxoprolinase subunit PxpB [Flavobacteriaceae bacterium]|nr:5-oxoprolinase subunit PxpB [Flavobacteriaceae bacterium]
MERYNLSYKPFGKRAILIEWPAKIDENILNDILNFKISILNSYTKEKVEVISAYNSLTINYYTTIENIYSEFSALKALYQQQNTQKKLKSKLWKIPVCYDEKFGIDLEEISQEKELSKSEIIRLHSNPKYTVFFIGFLPGFLYLGGLPKALHFPRKMNPRISVEKGAVGIGGSQTGVYPQQSSGGWNIIGNSPISFFDRKNPEPCFAKPGDKIQFVPIDIKMHSEIVDLSSYKRYKLESEVLNA